jgi:flagellar basal body-associated protein FliL
MPAHKVQVTPKQTSNKKWIIITVLVIILCIVVGAIVYKTIEQTHTSTNIVMTGVGSWSVTVSHM